MGGYDFLGISCERNNIKMDKPVPRIKPKKFHFDAALPILGGNPTNLATKGPKMAIWREFGGWM